VVGLYVRAYNVDLEETQPPAGSFASFDAFFTRPLRDGVRPLCPDPEALVSPADGCEVEPVPKGADRYAPVRPWQGGYHDPCRFGEWDYAGRAIKQYADQDARLLQMADLDVPDFEVREHHILRITRAQKR